MKSLFHGGPTADIYAKFKYKSIDSISLLFQSCECLNTFMLVIAKLI